MPPLGNCASAWNEVDARRQGLLRVLGEGGAVPTVRQGHSNWVASLLALIVLDGEVHRRVIVIDRIRVNYREAAPAQTAVLCALRPASQRALDFVVHLARRPRDGHAEVGHQVDVKADAAVGGVAAAEVEVAVGPEWVHFYRLGAGPGVVAMRKERSPIGVHVDGNRYLAKYLGRRLQWYDHIRRASCSHVDCDGTHSFPSNLSGSHLLFRGGSCVGECGVPCG